MSVLKDKSHFNREAAEICLIKNLYAPSVHCSYYSCIQYILHVLFEKLKMTEQTFNRQKSSLHVGTHMCAIKLLGYDLITKQQSDYKAFQRLIPELKELREKSDYTNLSIAQQDGHIAMNNSDSIKYILQKNYR